MRLVVEIEHELDCELPLVTVFERRTARGLTEWLRGRSGLDAPASRGPLVVVKEGKGTRPLFLVAGGRGGRAELALYGTIMARLAEDRPVYGIHRPPVGETVEQMARECILAIRRVQPRGPYDLGGECVGGVVAYEIAQQLAAAGEVVELLLLLDTWVPTTRGVLYHQILGQPLSLARAGIEFLSGLPARNSAEPWWQELRRRASVSPDERRYVEACMAYRPRRYAGDVTLLATEHSARRGIAQPWRAAIGGELRVVTTPGHHDNYTRRHALTTAEQVRRCIEDRA